MAAVANRADPSRTAADLEGLVELAKSALVDSTPDVKPIPVTTAIGRAARRYG
jgi:hypothetical protein